ncbi:MAG TPA: hypothetical protein VH044_13570, partial [Polyangiaceae bacterium]|nr:hypothetical protein [Polyangiaceae bacterium]
MIEPGFDASTDFDVAVGDDDSDDGDVDAGKMPPVKDAAPPKKDAVAPPMDAGGIIPLDSGGIIPMEDAGGGGGEPECDPIRCATGCCYG